MVKDIGLSYNLCEVISKVIRNSEDPKIALLEKERKGRWRKSRSEQYFSNF